MTATTRTDVARTPHGTHPCAEPYPNTRAALNPPIPCVDCGCVCFGYHRNDPERCWRHEQRPGQIGLGL